MLLLSVAAVGDVYDAANANQRRKKKEKTRVGVFLSLSLSLSLSDLLVHSFIPSLIITPQKVQVSFFLSVITLTIRITFLSLSKRCERHLLAGGKETSSENGRKERKFFFLDPKLVVISCWR